MYYRRLERPRIWRYRCSRGFQNGCLMMEDEELYNAGKGSVIAADGSVTMDASIMRGCDGAAGSIVNSRRLKNPINAAEKILQKGWPVMLNSEPADSWAMKWM